MKKTIIFLFAIGTLLTNAFAGDVPPMPKDLEKSFRENFPEAIQISWQKKDEVSIVDFRKDGVRHIAYFDVYSGFIGVLRYITSDHMPVKTLNILKKKYGDLSKTRALEAFTADGETFYFINIQHKGNVRTLKVYPDGGSEIMKNVF